MIEFRKGDIFCAKDLTAYCHGCNCSGAMGAGIGLVVAKYLDLSKSAQVLLALAGVGIGKYLLDQTKKHDRFLQHDKRLKVYNIDG